MIQVIVVLVVVGLCLYLIDTYVPLSPPIALVLRVVVVLCCCLWLLGVFGILDVPVPRIR